MRTFLVSLCVFFMIGVTVNAVSYEKLENGLTVIAEENRSADIVAMSLFIRSATRFELKEICGISSFVNQMLLRGTVKKTADELSEYIDEMGAQVDTKETKDYCEISIKTTSKNWKQALALLAEIALTPSFTKEEVENIREQMLQKLKIIEDDMWDYTENIFESQVYTQHPYRMPVCGTEKTIKYIKRKVLEEWHEKFYIPNNAVFSAAGNVSQEQMAAEVKKVFSGWKMQNIPLQILRMEAAKDMFKSLDSERAKWVIKDKEQVQLFFGFQAPSVMSGDFAALKIADAVLGEGMSSRLFVNLRDKQLLAY